MGLSDYLNKVTATATATLVAWHGYSLLARNRFDDFADLATDVADDATQTKKLSRVVARAVDKCAAKEDYRRFSHMLRKIKDHPALVDAINLESVEAMAKDAIKHRHTYDFTMLLESLNCHPRLTPLGLGLMHEAAEHALQNGYTNDVYTLATYIHPKSAYTDILRNALRRNVKEATKNQQHDHLLSLVSCAARTPSLIDAIEPSWIRITADIARIRDLYNAFPSILLNIVDKPRLMEAVQPEDIRMAFISMNQDNDISEFLEKIVKNPRLADANNIGFDVITIPAGADTHEYPIRLLINHEDGNASFYIGCMEKGSVADLKDHWDAHENDQRRTQAWPTVFNALSALAAGEKPAQASFTFIADHERLAQQAHTWNLEQYAPEPVPAV